MKKVIAGFIITMLLIPTCAFTKDLIFATDPFPPFYYQEAGMVKGLQYELANIIFSKMQTRFRIVFVPWKRALMMAESKMVDGVFGLRKTAERERWISYPEEPLMEVNTVIFKRKGDPFNYTGIPSLKGKIVGVTKGYTYGNEFDESDIFLKEEVVNLRHNFLKLLAGRIDLVAAYRTVGFHVLKKLDLQDRIEVCPVTIHVTPLYVGFSKTPGNGAICKEFSRILKIFKNSDECKETMQRLGATTEVISPCR
jgi:polar amino acid transport system substrate-binding protein